jgi:hypothetical protein
MLMLLSIPIKEVVDACYGGAAPIKTNTAPSVGCIVPLLKTVGAMLSIPIGEAADALGR